MFENKTITVYFIIALRHFFLYFLLNLTLSAHFKTTLVLELAPLPLARPAVPLVTF